MNDDIYNKKINIAETFEKYKDIFNIIGDSTRIKIISLLLESPNKEMSVDEITSYIYLSRPAVSHHIKTLRDAGIIKCRKEAMYNFYSLSRNTGIWNKLFEFFTQVNDLITNLGDESNEKGSSNN